MNKHRDHKITLNLPVVATDYEDLLYRGWCLLAEATELFLLFDLLGVRPLLCSILFSQPHEPVSRKSDE